MSYWRMINCSECKERFSTNKSRRLFCSPQCETRGNAKKIVPSKSDDGEYSLKTQKAVIKGYKDGMSMCKLKRTYGIRSEVFVRKILVDNDVAIRPSKMYPNT